MPSSPEKKKGEKGGDGGLIQEQKEMCGKKEILAEPVKERKFGRLFTKTHFTEAGGKTEKPKTGKGARRRVCLNREKTSQKRGGETGLPKIVGRKEGNSATYNENNRVTLPSPKRATTDARSCLDQIRREQRKIKVSSPKKRREIPSRECAPPLLGNGWYEKKGKDALRKDRKGRRAACEKEKKVASSGSTPMTKKGGKERCVKTKSKNNNEEEEKLQAIAILVWEGKARHAPRK